MNYFSIIMEQIGTFAVYACIGVIVVKCGVVDRQGLNLLSKLITKIILPLLIFSNTINGATKKEFLSSLPILIIAMVLYFILYWVALLMAKCMHLKGNRRNVYRACVMFGNCGFMGIPITMALFPQRGGMYIAIYSVIDQLVLWTIGSKLTAPVDVTKREAPVQTIKKMINPATIAIFLGIIVLISGLKLPAFFNTALSKTGAAATPLAMIYLGGMFCFIHIKDYLKKKEIYLMVAGKMIILPIVIYVILSHIQAVPAEIAVAISLICGLPTMSSVAMVAESQQSDSEYASGMIFATTLLSIITLPVICTIY